MGVVKTQQIRFHAKHRVLGVVFPVSERGEWLRWKRTGKNGKGIWRDGVIVAGVYKTETCQFRPGSKLTRYKVISSSSFHDAGGGDRIWWHFSTKCLLERAAVIARLHIPWTTKTRWCWWVTHPAHNRLWTFCYPINDLDFQPTKASLGWSWRYGMRSIVDRL